MSVSNLDGVVRAGHARLRHVHNPADNGWRLIFDVLRAAVREPLVQFVILGAALFCAVQVHKSLTDTHRIVVDKARVHQISDTYATQYGERPDPKTLDALANAWVQEEVLYREGVSRGLDREDEIVKRRIAQKMQFLQLDLNAPEEPAAPALLSYYRAHPGQYRSPARATFSHIYFSPDVAGDAAARMRAQAALKSLSAGVTRAPAVGDTFQDRSDYAGIDRSDADKLFGASELPAAIFAAPVGVWSGPYRSGFGWHLLRVSDRAAPQLKPFEAVRDQVRLDYLNEAQAKANQASLDRLISRYHVRREDRPHG